MTETAKVQFSWKRRPSEIKGFDRAMYTTLDNGDYIRIDYNIVDNMARVYVEIDGDRTSPYYAIINKGRVTLERNNAGRSSKVAEIISARASQFSSIPNKEILKIVNRNYGIIDSSEPVPENKADRGQVTRDQIRKKYFKNDANPYEQESASVKSSFISGFSFVDLIDFVVGIVLIGAAFFFSQYSLLTVGTVAILWGLVLGFLDIVLRNREPVFTKIIFFLFGGAFVYIYGYFYY